MENLIGDGQDAKESVWAYYYKGRLIIKSQVSYALFSHDSCRVPVENTYGIQESVNHYKIVKSTQVNDLFIAIVLTEH